MVFLVILKSAKIQYTFAILLLYQPTHSLLVALDHTFEIEHHVHIELFLRDPMSHSINALSQLGVSEFAQIQIEQSQVRKKQHLIIFLLDVFRRSVR